MKKARVQVVLSLFMLIVITRSVYPPWIQTNWLSSNSFFSLFTSQDKVFARIWDSLYGGRMFLTADDGTNWTQISSADSDIDILSIVMLDSNILAGTWNGFYLSTDDGTTWNAVTPTGIPADTAIWSIAMIDITLFAGTTGDIYKSSDNGNTWTEVNSGIPVDARITSFVESGDAIFAGSASNGVFKTTNGGTSWTENNSGLPDMHISQLVVLGTRLFAVTLKGVYISDNEGMSWVADNSSLVNVNCFVVVNDQLFAGTDDSGVYLSVDSGATWTSVTSGMPTDTRVWSLAVSSGYIFAGTSSGVWRMLIRTASFTITACASIGGTISPAGNITVYENNSQTFTITPTIGYHVLDVLVDSTSVGAVTSYTFSNVTVDHTIAASFSIDTHALTYAAGAGGTIIAPPLTSPQIYDYGTVVTITASPNPDYHFVNWTGDVGKVANVNAASTTITMNGDYSIMANFAKDMHTLTFAAGTGGSITAPSGPSPKTYNYGTVVSIIASPDANYHFVNWTGDMSTVVDANAASTFITMNGDYSITANFALLPVITVMSVVQSSTGSAPWTVVTGSLAAGYQLPLNGVPTDSVYLNVASMMANTTLKDGQYNPFTLDTSSVPGNFYSYWAAKGVCTTCSGTWEPFMWQIISGVEPIFYLKVSGGTYNLVDGLGRLMGGADGFPRINGDHPSGTYTVDGLLTAADGGTNPMVTKLTTNIVDQTLNVNKTGTGTGTVTSTPPGINCGSTCMFNYPYGTDVTLSATPTDHYNRFLGWSGTGISCPGTDTCTVEMTAARTITATFEKSTFGDVPFDDVFWPYIEALYAGGYTSGCSTDPMMFCPKATLTRAESAVFMLRGLLGSGYTPPTTGYVFVNDDWTPSTVSWARSWAEGMWDDGMTSGCQANPLMFCPAATLTRAEGSVFGLRIMHGMSYLPPEELPEHIFADDWNPAAINWAEPWAEQAYHDGLLLSCATSPLRFCPADPLTRSWAAYLIVKAKDLPLNP